MSAPDAKTGHTWGPGVAAGAQAAASAGKASPADDGGAPGAGLAPGAGHVAVLMPAAAPAATEGTLVRWFVVEGASVTVGDVLAEVRAGRASLEVEAVADGRVLRILVPAGTANVVVATPIAVVATDNGAAAGEVLAQRPAPAVAPGQTPTPATLQPAGVAPAAVTPALPPAATVGGLIASTVASPLPQTLVGAAVVGAAVAASLPEAKSGTAGAPAAPVVQPAPGSPPASAVAAAPHTAPHTATQAQAATNAAPQAVPQATAPTTPRQPAKLQRITYREALRSALAEEMRQNADVFLIGEEVGEHQGTHRVTEGLLAEFGPTRVVDTPITEAGFTGLAVGAAMAGLRPVVEFMSWNFALLALDHIVNSAAKTLYMSGGVQKVPIVLRGPNGPSARAGAQHAQCLASWLAHVPGLKVVAPSNAADAKGLLKSAIRDGGPVVVLEHEALYAVSGDVPDDEAFRVPIGRAAVVRSGADVTLVSYSRGVALALQAAEQLATQGIAAEVVDLRSLRPLDLGTITASVRKTNRLVTVEESWPVCSIGAEICAAIAAVAFDDLDAPPTRVTGADVPMPYAENLERLALPSVDRVVAAAHSVLYV